MRCSGRKLACAAVSAAVAALGGPAVAGGAQAASGPVSVVTEFSAGQFPEGLAIDGRGRRFVSVTTWGATENDPGTGQVVRVTGAGRKVPVGPVFDVGFGVLTGVAIGPDGRPYVAVASNQASQPPGVFRLAAGGAATRVLTLTDDSFPNGLAFRGGRLYVSDSALGVIWRVGRGGKGSAWSRAGLLAPPHGKTFGANGIAFRGRALYVAVTDRGAILRIPIRRGGAAGRAVVVAKRRALAGADGIAFDATGRLVVATSHANTLVRLAAGGRLTRLAGPGDGLLYPTTPAFGGRRSGRLLVVNGDYMAKGTPSLLAVR